MNTDRTFALWTTYTAGYCSQNEQQQRPYTPSWHFFSVGLYFFFLLVCVCVCFGVFVWVARRPKKRKGHGVDNKSSSLSNKNNILETLDLFMIALCSFLFFLGLSCEILSFFFDPDVFRNPHNNPNLIQLAHIHTHTTVFVFSEITFGWNYIYNYYPLNQKPP